MSAATDLPEMQYRFLGRSGLQVSCIALGSWLTYGGHTSNDTTFACMKAAWDAGINFFDCAEVYGDGESERVMGEAIRKFGWKRNDIVISTKIYWGEAFGDRKINNKGLSRKHLIEGTRASLQRLGLEYVDLLYAHRPDRHTPMEEVVRTFNFLINQGLCFYWGTSDWDPVEIERAHNVANRLGLIGPIMEQPEYSMLERERVDKDYRLLYMEYGLALTTFSPLKGGILTGKYNNGVPKDSRFATSTDEYAKEMQEHVQSEAWQAEARKVAALKPIAEKLGGTQAQLALAWVLKNNNVAAAITGASRPQQIVDSVKCLNLLPKMTAEVMEEIDAILGNKPAPLEMRGD